MTEVDGIGRKLALECRKLELEIRDLSQPFRRPAVVAQMALLVIGVGGAAGGWLNQSLTHRAEKLAATEAVQQARRKARLASLRSLQADAKTSRAREEILDARLIMSEVHRDTARALTLLKEKRTDSLKDLLEQIDRATDRSVREARTRFGKEVNLHVFGEEEEEASLLAKWAKPGDTIRCKLWLEFEGDEFEIRVVTLNRSEDSQDKQGKVHNALQGMLQGGSGGALKALVLGSDELIESLTRRVLLRSEAAHVLMR